jgi:hypothetical protein
VKILEEKEEGYGSMRRIQKLLRSGEEYNGPKGEEERESLKVCKEN